MPLPPLASVVREFWGHIADGCTAAEAGVAVGVSAHTGVRWLRDAGGVKPRLIEPTTSGPRPRLCLSERIEIQCGVRSNESLQSIGERLGRSASTIKREIDNNGLHVLHNPQRRSGYRRKWAFGARQSGSSATVRYCALTAQVLADRRARRVRAGKLALNDRLRDEVQERLLDAHSPAQIAPAVADGFSRRCGDAGVTRNHLSVIFTCRAKEICAVNCTPVCVPVERCVNPSGVPIKAGAACATWSVSVSAHLRSRTGRCPGTGRAI